MTSHQMADQHLVAIARGGWHAWRWAIVRSAGFAVEGLDGLAAPECAKAADECLDEATGGAAGRAFDGEFAAAALAVTKATTEIAADPAFLMAMNWQNPGAAEWIYGAATPRSSRRGYDRRRREEIIAKYWQRYCVKNDSVGFFGPICWASIDLAGPPVAGTHGPGLVRRAYVHFERWALDAVAEQISADPAARPSLPASVQAGDSIAGELLLRPSRPPQALSGVEATLISRCDGRRTAQDIAGELVADARTGFRQEADVYALMERCVERGLLRWGIDLPMDLSAEVSLRTQVERIADPLARATAADMLDRMCRARDAVAAAAEPSGLRAAIAELEAEFTQITGRRPRHREGKVYAGRTLCHLDAARDLDLVIGGAVVARLAPLEPLLLSARWLTAEVASEFSSELDHLYHDLAADAATAEVPFSQLWFLALGPLLGADAVPEKVVAEFRARWSQVLGLNPTTERASRLDLTAPELLAKVKQAFSAAAPGWATARIHTPDLHLCAPSVEAVQRGEFSIVLGELHVAVAGFDTQFFSIAHPAPGEMTAGMLADLPTGQVHLLSPDDWPRLSARNAEWMIGPNDIQLGFAPAAGADQGRLVPITSLVAVAESGRLIVRAPDGRTWPAIEMFATVLSQRVFDTWKLVGGTTHTPRVTVDGLVVLRETWRMTVADTGLADVTGERDRYLAARRWRRDLGLPERIFILIGTEAKPCYLDLTSPVYARILCGMLRAARQQGGPDTTVIITEMLPATEHAWLTDASGLRYSSELRLQIRDPVPAGYARQSAMLESTRMA